MDSESSKLLEIGDVYFFYRPKVKSSAKENSAHGIQDIQRFFIVLHPKKPKKYRLIMLGAKMLPDINHRHEKNWSVVELVTRRKKALVNKLSQHYYTTKTKGKRFLPDCRPVGEGVYSIVEQGRNTYFSYSLALPTELAQPQQAFQLKPNASYVMFVKNPTKSGRQVSYPVNYPAYLMRLFRNLRFIPLRSAKFLNYQGTELLLIGAELSAKSINQPKRQHETIDSAMIFKDLHLWKNDHSIDPLFKGRWK